MDELSRPRGEVHPSAERQRGRRRGDPIRRTTAQKAVRRPDLVTIIGEVFLTTAVLVFLFLGWQNWFNDLVVGASQQEAASDLSKQWIDFGGGVLDSTRTSPTAEPGQPSPLSTPPRPSAAEPPVMTLANDAKAFAILIIPRFGEDFRRSISEGVGVDVLNGRLSGVGHYSETQVPGEVGNFAVAAHRTTYGRSFHNIDLLVTGDHIYIETADGWFRYVYRNTEYVYPTGVGVLAPLPQFEQITTTDRVLTMTSCNPRFSAAERIIAYSVMDAWFPRSGGQPEEIAQQSTETRS